MGLHLCKVTNTFLRLILLEAEFIKNRIRQIDGIALFDVAFLDLESHIELLGFRLQIIILPRYDAMILHKV